MLAKRFPQISQKILLHRGCAPVALRLRCVELGGIERPELLATLIADHRLRCLARLQLGYLGLSSFLVVVVVFGLSGLRSLDFVKRLVLVLLDPIKSSLY